MTIKIQIDMNSDVGGEFWRLRTGIEECWRDGHPNEMVCLISMNLLYLDKGVRLRAGCGNCDRGSPIDP